MDPPDQQDRKELLDSKVLREIRAILVRMATLVFKVLQVLLVPQVNPDSKVESVL